MITSVFPCLWFNDNAREAVDFYLSVFGGEITRQNDMVIWFETRGSRFMALNGGPKYAVNSAISYFVYCGSEAEIDRLYALLCDAGKVWMPLGTYPWTSKYAMVQDRFGVLWQLDIDDIRVTQKIVPALMFANEKMGRVREALKHYSGLFPESRILLESPFGPGSGHEDKLLFAQCKIAGAVMNLMSNPTGGGDDFTPGNSLVAMCENQADIDHLWEGLGSDGHYDRCGWLRDRFGVSWQVLPAVLPELMTDPERAPRVAQAFLPMQKFDIQTLLNA